MKKLILLAAVILAGAMSLQARAPNVVSVRILSNIRRSLPQLLRA